MSRKKYLVQGADGKDTEVFADEAMITTTGDVIFNQVKDGEIMQQDGSKQIGKVLELVLIISKAEYKSVALVNDKNIPLYKDSGRIVH